MQRISNVKTSFVSNQVRQIRSGLENPYINVCLRKGCKDAFNSWQHKYHQTIHHQTYIFKRIQRNEIEMDFVTVLYYKIISATHSTFQHPSHLESRIIVPNIHTVRSSTEDLIAVYNVHVSLASHHSSVTKQSTQQSTVVLGSCLC